MCSKKDKEHYNIISFPDLSLTVVLLWLPHQPQKFETPQLVGFLCFGEAMFAERSKMTNCCPEIGNQTETISDSSDIGGAPVPLRA